MPITYAVLVGIEKYPHVSQLSGCINDIDAAESWLKKTYPGKDDLKTKRLTDDMAGKNPPTRDNILSAFDLFREADDEDTCLFYYCGHGANLIAPSEFTYQDKVLQALVCIDFEQLDKDKPVNGALTDKELSYLVWDITKDKPGISFIVITDCCHSGTMTRDIRVKARALTDSTFISPPLKEFYGYDSENQNGYKLTGSNCSVQTGRHLHFAAAEDNQVAQEVDDGSKPRGAFSCALFQLLEEEPGLFSYQQLIDSIAVRIQNDFYQSGIAPQTPRLNVSTNMPADAGDYIFLTSRNIKQSRTFLVYYREEHDWCIKAGLLQNLSEGDSVEMDAGDNQITFTVIQTFPDFSRIAQAGMLRPVDNKKVYQGKVKGQIKNTTRFYLDRTVPALWKQQLLDGQYKTDAGAPAVNFQGVELIDSVEFDATSDFVLSVSNGELKLTGPKTHLLRSPRESLLTGEVSTILEKIRKVSNWNVALHVNNPAADGPKPYQIDLQYSTDNESGVYHYIQGQLNGSPNRVSYYGNGAVKPTFRLGIFNSGPTTLWVTFAYLGADYSIETCFNFLYIEPGETKWMLMDDSDVMTLENSTPEAINEYLKVCVTFLEGGIRLSSLQQDPVAVNLKERSIGTFKAPLVYPADYWQMETIGFLIHSQ